MPKILITVARGPLSPEEETRILKACAQRVEWKHRDTTFYKPLHKMASPINMGMPYYSGHQKRWHNLKKGSPS